jgi:mannose-6-phosphate isomerase-like protein (cupin superfamily)
MADYTKVNLLDVEDQARKFGIDGLESRFARRSLDMEGGGVTHFRMKPGFRQPFGHRHREQEEVYVVLSGNMTVAIDDETVELGPLEAVRLPAAAKRAVEAGPEGAEYLAFGVGADARDAETLPGWWGDGEGG